MPVASGPARLQWWRHYVSGILLHDVPGIGNRDQGEVFAHPVARVVQPGETDPISQPTLSIGMPCGRAVRVCFRYTIEMANFADFLGTRLSMTRGGPIFPRSPAPSSTPLSLLG